MYSVVMERVVETSLTMNWKTGLADGCLTDQTILLHHPKYFQRLVRQVCNPFMEYQWDIRRKIATMQRYVRPYVIYFITDSRSSIIFISYYHFLE